MKDLIKQIIDSNLEVIVLYDSDHIFQYDEEHFYSDSEEYLISEIDYDFIKFISLDEIEVPIDLRKYLKLISTVQKTFGNIQSSKQKYWVKYDEHYDIISIEDFENLYDLEFVWNKTIQIFEITYLKAEQVQRFLNAK